MRCGGWLAWGGRSSGESWGPGGARGSSSSCGVKPLRSGRGRRSAPLAPSLKVMGPGRTGRSAVLPSLSPFLSTHCGLSCGTESCALSCCVLSYGILSSGILSSVAWCCVLSSGTFSCCVLSIVSSCREAGMGMAAGDNRTIGGTAHGDDGTEPSLAAGLGTAGTGAGAGAGVGADAGVGQGRGGASEGGSGTGGLEHG